MRSQGFRGLRGETYGPAALFVFRFAERYFPAAPGQRAPHAQDVVLHVHVLPPECEHLSLPHTGVDGEYVEGFERSSAAASSSLCVSSVERATISFATGFGGFTTSATLRGVRCQSTACASPRRRMSCILRTVEALSPVS